MIGRLPAAALGAIVVLMLTPACGNGRTQAAIVGYRPGATDRQLILVAETGPEDTIVSVNVLAQDDKSVTVEVIMRRHPDIQPAIAVSHDLPVELAKPLGDREVHGPSGNVIPLK